MKHKIINKQPLSNRNCIVTVQLIPETEIEKQAIQNTAIVKATDNERELINNYLLFNLGLGNYSVLTLNEQYKTEFKLTVHLN